jgi:hypothetical protein
MSNKTTPVISSIGSFLLASALFLICSLSAIKSHAQAFPRPDHIVILIEENEPNTWVVGDHSALGNPQTYAPNINELASDSMSAVFTGFYAQTHPSQPNYLYMFSGDAQGSTSDNVPVNYPFTTPNLAYQLLSQGLTFKTYSEDLPYVGAQDTTSTAPGTSYARKHNPVANWQGTGVNQVPDSLSQPFNGLPADYSQLPTVSYVVPNEDSDMHNEAGIPGISSGDTWFCEHLECYNQRSFMDWVRTHNTLFILTFDEDNGFYENNIPTIFFGPMVQGGSYTQSVNLLSLLGMIEDMYGLGYATNAAGTAPPINFCWKAGATGINNVNTGTPGLNIYPNPSTSKLTIDGSKWTGQASEISITDLTGRVIDRFALPDSKKTDLDVSAYAAGLYFYHLDQANTIVGSGKFTVAH